MCFTHAPRTGRKRLPDILLRIVSAHAPRTGRHKLGVILTLGVSTHAPRTGAAADHRMGWEKVNPRPVRGRRRWSRLTGRSWFQPTRPVRARRGRPGPARRMEVSPTRPLRGTANLLRQTDKDWFRAPRTARRGNLIYQRDVGVSTAPVRAQRMSPTTGAIWFNPRAPYGGGPAFDGEPFMVRFQPTRPVRGARLHVGLAHNPVSAAPVRGGLSRCQSSAKLKVSTTRPCRRGLSLIYIWQTRQSLTARPVRAQPKVGDSATVTVPFQPTRPVRARLHLLLIPQVVHQFQPRPVRKGQAKHRAAIAEIEVFQPAPRTGRGNYCWRSELGGNVSTRAPYGARHHEPSKSP